MERRTRETWRGLNDRLAVSVLTSPEKAVTLPRDFAKASPCTAPAFPWKRRVTALAFPRKRHVTALAFPGRSCRALRRRFEIRGLLDSSPPRCIVRFVTPCAWTIARLPLGPELSPSAALPRQPAPSCAVGRTTSSIPDDVPERRDEGNMTSSTPF